VEDKRGAVIAMNLQAVWKYFATIAHYGFEDAMVELLHLDSRGVIVQQVHADRVGTISTDGDEVMRRMRTENGMRIRMLEGEQAIEVNERQRSNLAGKCHPQSDTASAPYPE